MLKYVQRQASACSFERPEGMPELLHRILMRRGIDSEAASQRFLNPSEADIIDPMQLSSMKEAVTSIKEAMDAGISICVYGDYDVDGVCASAILMDYFREQGASAFVYLPSRHNEGYGLNLNAVREVSKRAGLLLTVDCGVGSVEEIALAKQLGMKCVITDHHRPPEILPDCPIVNPLLAGYPFSSLCGAGVAFKLVWALGGREAAMARIDLAALASVADVVSLTGENRAIVALGLQRINAMPRTGIAALMEVARIEPGALDSMGIAFRLAPRLNAGGRIGSAQRSYELLMQREPFLAAAQADELENENAKRQSIEREIYTQAEAQLADFDFTRHRIIMVSGEGWNSGVIGLTASHLREKYFYPTIVFSKQDGLMTGSCRSIPGVDIHKALTGAKDLMVRYGGHEQAAGLTIEEGKFDQLRVALDAFMFEQYGSELFLPAKEYDLEATLPECSEALVRSLEKLEPTGSGNPEVVLRSSVQLVEARAIGKQGAHLRVTCAQGGVRRSGIFFGAGERQDEITSGAEILFTPSLNTWNGLTSVQLRLHAMQNGDDFERIDAVMKQEGALQRRFLTELFYNRGIEHARSMGTTSVQALRESLMQQMQGTWIICATLDEARSLLEELKGCRLDIHIGSAPGDARAFNSLIVCPGELTAFPKGIRRIVFAACPAMKGMPEDAELIELGGSCPLFSLLPDKDQLRTVYLSARHLKSRPAYIPDANAMDVVFADDTGLSEICCRAALLVLADMGLIALRDKPCGYEIMPMQKKEPSESALWCTMQQLRARALEELEGRDGA